jgi:hypothetical protein
MPRRKTISVSLADLLCATAFGALAQRDNRDDDEPREYRDRPDVQEAYRRGYERGYDRGYRKGFQEGERRPAYAAPPPPAPPAAPRPPVLGPIRVESAFYGNGKKSCNATRYVRRQADGNRQYSFKVSNDMCGDPAHGDRKTLEVSYLCGEILRNASAREHQTIFLNCLN